MFISELIQEGKDMSPGPRFIREQLVIQLSEPGRGGMRYWASKPCLMPSQERLGYRQERGPFSHTTTVTYDLRSPRNWTHNKERLSNSALETGGASYERDMGFFIFLG